MEKENTVIHSLSTIEQLHSLIEKFNSFLAIVFYSDASQRSKDALAIVTEIKKQKPDVAVASVNVSHVRDIHPLFGVSSVPTVITLRKSVLSKKVEGLQQKSTYTMLLGSAPRRRADGTEAPPLRVTVYSSPTCPPCGVVKAYLRKKGVPFRVIDVTRDEQAAQEIMSRTGSMAVPQTDINGTVVIGADMARFDELLKV
jgi:glutaredoxin-like YruB-family protein